MQHTGSTIIFTSTSTSYEVICIFSPSLSLPLPFSLSHFLSFKSSVFLLLAIVIFRIRRCTIHIVITLPMLLRILIVTMNKKRVGKYNKFLRR